MLLADNYIDRIDFLQYLPRTDCGACGKRTCREFVRDLKRAENRPSDCPDLARSLYYSFEIALDADNILPKFPCITDPRPGPTGVVEVNEPGKDSSILVSGNHVHTQDVLMSILSTTRTGFFLLFTDTKGHTVDMAVIYETLTTTQIMKSLETSGLLAKTSHPDILLPGLARAVGVELKQSTNWDVVVGPICAGELPLFWSDRWSPPSLMSKA
jgi:CO dehydrogenase/acetyl-CoA synthase gamma subunit (corrinoid Fe-S protein)